MSITSTQFAIGQVVKHRLYEFRGVIVDVDPDMCIGCKGCSKISHNKLIISVRLNPVRVSELVFVEIDHGRYLP